MFMNQIIGTPITAVNRNSDSFVLDNIGMSIGTRIRERRKEIKLTQQALAQKVGMAQASLSELETGESNSSTLLASIAAALGINALWLEAGKGPKLVSETPPSSPYGFVTPDESPFITEAAPVVAGIPPDTTPVKMVTLKLRGGVTGFACEPDLTLGGICYLPNEVISELNLNVSELLAMRVRGDSMSPLLDDGNIAVVNTGRREPISKAIFALNWNGEPIVKMLLRRNDEWYIHSINPDFGDENVRTAQCSIVGEVIYQPGRMLGRRS